MFLSATAAWAHEQRQVGAQQLSVGWQHEPTYVGVENAVQLFIKVAKVNPVDDLGNPPTLQATVSTGAKTSDPSRSGVVRPGHQPRHARRVRCGCDPDTPGTYTFHVTGTIGGQKIDEKFTSSDSTFDNVQAPAAIEFPNQDPTNGDLATNLTRLAPRITKASDKASSANTLALVALIVGVVVGGAGIAVGFTRDRSHA